MNKIKNLLLGIFFLSISTNLNAKTFDEPTAYWGLNYYSYTEDTSTQDPFMEEKTDLLPTVIIGYRDFNSITSGSKNLSWFVEGAYGQVEYSQYTGVGTHTHEYFKFQGEALYPIANSFYAGLGYRYLYDYLSDYGAGGYDRQNQLVYLPIGYVLNSIDSTTKFQFNYLIEGEQKSYLSDISGYADLTNKQKDGWGLDVSYAPKKSSWELFAKYWNIDDSTINTSTGTSFIITGLEPHNETYEVGVKFAF
jgi:hypothetical protein